MNSRIVEYAKALDQVSRERRRDFHRFAETAWLEMRTSAIISKVLTELGYEVVTGKALCLEEARIGVPAPEELQAHWKLALEQGAPAEYLTEEMKEGFTGVMGVLRCGQGPVVALRFDIDALGILEDEKESHRPFREGFSSVNPGVMHACGHDGHGAIGLGVAEILMKLKPDLCGTIKLIFQPGEEGAKGARAIVASGHLDDVDYFVGTHIAPDDGPDDGDVTPGTWGSLATSKYDAHFYGQAAHAGGFPEKGRNAVAAACSAVMNLMAIARHSGGISRVNVGTIQGGTGRNVVPDHALIQFEVRGETTEINRFMDEEAVRICGGAAQMWGCTCELVFQGGAESQHSDVDFLERIGEVVERDLPHLRVSSCKNARNWGSEDISLMMNRVQEHGGKAVYMRSMTSVASAQHTTAFDFDEKVLVEAMETFGAIVWELCKDVKAIDKVALLYVKDGKILSTRSRGKDKYYLPGGKREGDETDLETLAREIREELSVDVVEATARFYGTFEAQAHGKEEGVLVRMTCYTAELEGELRADSEIAEIVWLTCRDMESVSPVDKLIFGDLREKGLLD